MEEYQAILPYDPDCQGVILFRESLKNENESIIDETVKEFVYKHRLTCERCLDYGLKNISLIKIEDLKKDHNLWFISEKTMMEDNRII